MTMLDLAHDAKEGWRSVKIFCMLEAQFLGITTVLHYLLVVRLCAILNKNVLALTLVNVAIHSTLSQCESTQSSVGAEITLIGQVTPSQLKHTIVNANTF